VNHQTRRDEIADKPAGRSDLDAIARMDVGSGISLDDDKARVDLGGDAAATADDHRVASMDLSLDLSVDAHTALESEDTDDPAAFADTSVALFVLGFD
jgi:hypothetical protein